MRVFISKRKRK